MKRNDWILAGIVILIAAIFLMIHNMIPSNSNAMIKITIDGDLYGSYSLYEDQTIDINNTNTFIIEKGTGKMCKADCPDQLCVHQKAISKTGESIICLPNKVVVSVIGGEENELDAITN